MTVSTIDIPVLHSADIVHFHREPWFILSSEVANLLTHYQEKSAGFTMNPFKGFPNKLVAARFLIDKQM